MSENFVLVHGAWMAPFCWDQVRPLLEAEGNRVTTVQLPAHGDDPAPAEQASLEGYRDAVVAALPAEGAVVVGHSLAGMVISAVGEAAPERVKALVYVAAYLPQSGESLYELAQKDADSLTGKYWHQEDPAHYSPASILPEGRVAVFAADCPEPAQKLIQERHRAEPVPPMATPVQLSAERFGSLRKVYVATTEDRCVSHALQRQMLAGYPGIEVHELESSHCPFFSQREKLASILRDVAR